jgi:AraC family transcriptional regulator
MHAMWKSEARIQVADIRAEVGDFEWPRPVETRDCAAEHQLSLSISRRPARSQIRHDTGGYTRTGFADVGDVVFFPASIPYCGRSEGGRQRLLTCCFASERWSSLLPDHGTWSDGDLKAAVDVRDSKLRGTLIRMAQEVLNPGFASGVLMEALLSAALVDLARYLKRSGKGEKLRNGGLAAWQLRRLKERIETLEIGTPSVAELARLCGISTRHLTRSFKQAHGTTLHRYMEEVRLRRAQSLLVDTDLPLKTISWRLGFAHPSSFSSAFQHAIGQTPSAFRAQSLRDT